MGAESVAQNPLQWGPFQFQPHLDYRLSYSSGLLTGPGQTAETVQHAVSPGLSILSKHLVLDYTPTLNYYSKGRYEDSLNHNASLRANFGYGDWRFGISQSYAAGSQVLIETARQTETESYNTGLTASYRLTERTSFDLTASQAISDTTSFNSSITWSTMNWLNYQVTDLTRFGIGLGGGYADVTQGSDSTFEQIQGRIDWLPRPKITVNLNGGVEIRQFLAQTGAGDLINPLVGFSASYRPFNYTTVSLSANRGVSTSLFADQVTENTSLTASLSQHFLERFQASVSGGLRQIDYQSSSRLVAAGRSDTVTFVSTSLGTQIFQKGNISISYSHTTNDSNEAGYTYDNDTIGLQLGYRF